MLAEQKLHVNLKKTYPPSNGEQNIHDVYKNCAIHENANWSIYMNISDI